MSKDKLVFYLDGKRYGYKKRHEFFAALQAEYPNVWSNIIK